MNRSTQIQPGRSTVIDTPGIPAGPPSLAPAPTGSPAASVPNGNVAVIRPRRRASKDRHHPEPGSRQTVEAQAAKAGRLEAYVDWLLQTHPLDDHSLASNGQAARGMERDHHARRTPESGQPWSSTEAAEHHNRPNRLPVADMDHPWKDPTKPTRPTSPPQRPQRPSEDAADGVPPIASPLPAGPQLNVYRLDRPGSTTYVPAAHVGFADDSVPTTTDPGVPRREDANRNYVASISSAIAAALGNAPTSETQDQTEAFLTREAFGPRADDPHPHAEELIEDMIQIRLDQERVTSPQVLPEDILVAELLKQRLSESSLSPPGEGLPKASTPAEDQARGQVAADDLQEAQQRQIPLKLAAWDVEDFRWPVVSNQMIVSGGHALDELLTQTLHQVANRPRRIAISGASRSLGSTSIAISLARWSAAKGLKTLLIDADVASPELSSRVGMASNMSWLNGVNKDLPVAELVIRSRANDLCVMPLASTVTRVTWPRFIFDNLGELLDPVKEDFDLILIDTGPASQVLDELSSPDRLIDGMLLLQDPQLRKIDTIQNRLVTFGIDNFVLVSNRQAVATPEVA